MGNEEDLRGIKEANVAPNFGCTFGGAFFTINWLRMRFLAQMLAADWSNALFFEERNLFLAGSVSVLFSPLLCQSDARNLQNLHLHLGNCWGLVILEISSYAYTYTLKLCRIRVVT